MGLIVSKRRAAELEYLRNYKPSGNNFQPAKKKFKKGLTLEEFSIGVDPYKKPARKVRQKMKKMVTPPSVGEQMIIDYLDKCGIRYIREKTFKDLINPVTGKNLWMDFYLLNHKTCIEFDGKQHFFKSKKFDKKGDSLEWRQTKDGIKNSYCEKKGIKMIRVHYKEINNIPALLTSYGLVKSPRLGSQGLG